MVNPDFDPVRGMNEFLPAEQRALMAIERALLDRFEQYGYQPIGLPVVEPTALFLRKSGEEIADRMYAFSHYNRRICLRPEMTASAIRAYVRRFGGQGSPMRLAYAGPVFRYERPQRLRYRQFTHAGVELIGAAGASADAEVLALACRSTELVGVTGWSVVVGHVGVAAELLDQLRLTDRVKGLVFANLERLARDDEAGDRLVERLQRLGALAPSQSDGGVSDDEGDGDTPTVNAIADLARVVGQDQARAIVGEVIRAMRIDLSSGSRDPDEIIARLIRKADRADQLPDVRRAIEFVRRLRATRGKPPVVFATLTELLREYGLSQAPLADLQRICELLPHYGVNLDRITIDLALGRGLQYYTGFIFEIYHGGLGAEAQLCGGGRYDGLVRSLGGSDTPASGFAFGVERLQAAAEVDGAIATATSRVVAIVAPANAAATKAAIGVAEWLRAAGLAVELDPRGRGIGMAFRGASRTSTPFGVIVEVDASAAVATRLRDLRSGEETVMSIEAIEALLKQSLAKSRGEAANCAIWSVATGVDERTSPEASQ